METTKMTPAQEDALWSAHQLLTDTHEKLVSLIYDFENHVMKDGRSQALMDAAKFVVYAINTVNIEEKA